jgi:death-on-curing protein
MEDEIFYFDVKHAIEVHDYIIDVSGGLHGYRDIGLLDGYDYCVSAFMLRMENIVVWVAEGKIDKDLLGEIICSLIEEDDYNESLKLKIIGAVTE